MYEFSLCGELEMRGDGSKGKVLDHLSCCILWISLWGKEKGGFLQGEHENRGGRWIKTCQRNRRRREKLQEQDLDRVATHPRYSICLQLHSLLLYFWSKMQVKNDCSASLFVTVTAIHGVHELVFAFETASWLMRLLEGSTRLMIACIWYTSRLALRDLDNQWHKQPMGEKREEEGKEEELGKGGGGTQMERTVERHDIIFLPQ